MENALCTPHLGYAEREGYEGIYAGGVERLLAWAAGAPIDVVNPEALQRTQR
jgi:D-3-phosphoglycerate dehydrogenase